MNGQMDKSLFFLTLSCVCIWLIVDAAIGKKYLSNFLSIIFPFMAGDSGAENEQTATAATDTKNSVSQYGEVRA